MKIHTASTQNAAVQPGHLTRNLFVVVAGSLLAVAVIGIVILSRAGGEPTLRTKADSFPAAAAVATGQHTPGFART